MKTEVNSPKPVQSEEYFSPEPTEDTEELQKDSSSDHVRQLFLMLLSVSALMVLLSTILKLDYLPGILLGCVIIGLNLHWTVHFVRNLVQDRKLHPINLIFYLSKFALSALVLFGALNWLEIPPLALLIGLSNILIAVMTYSVKSSLKKPANLESEESIK